MAEAYYNHFTKTNDAVSAGVSDTAYKKYFRPVDEVVQVMQEEGIDVYDKKVKKLTEEMVHKADKIFVLCDKEMCPAFLAESKKVTFWEVQDPYEMSIEHFRRIRDIIKLKVKDII
jgi:protein-tyrosine-phosphatase